MALYEYKGHVSFLRAHELSTGYGPDSDFLDDEAIVKLDSHPDLAFGFKLREDATLPAHQEMFQLLSDAMRNKWTVIIDADAIEGRKNYELLRVAAVAA